MAKRRLSDRTLLALKPAPSGKRFVLMDEEARGLGVRVNDRGLKTFILIARYPGSKNPTRRAIGEYPTVSLADAREEVRNWRKMLKEGIDPRAEREKRKLAEARRQENSFASVAEEYFKHMKRQGLRRADEVERDIRREFVTRWAKRPITDITRHDVMQVIEAAIDRDAPWQAHHVLSYASRLFNWAIERGAYGLDRSPVERMRPSTIIGPKTLRTRVLNDEEMRAVWRAARRVGYPFGPLFRLLLLTGQRRGEVAEVRWGEIDLKRKLWTIPHTRMKAGAAHVVPLTDDAVELLKGLPRFTEGDYVFTTTGGAKPVSGHSKGKSRLDNEMLLSWRALGRIDGTDRRKLNFDPFTVHDLRRTMRTGLSALPVPDLVRELVIGHTKQGLHKVYDQYAYLDEKRHALELWEARLRLIIEPPTANVVPIRGIHRG